jgi:hypothetical protein
VRRVAVTVFALAAACTGVCCLQIVGVQELTLTTRDGGKRSDAKMDAKMDSGVDVACNADVSGHTGCLEAGACGCMVNADCCDMFCNSAAQCESCQGAGGPCTEDIECCIGLECSGSVGGYCFM